MGGRDNLTRDEARARARLVHDVHYEVDLDLTGEERFRSETVIRFRCREPGADTFLDLLAPEVRSAELNGAALPSFDGFRLQLKGLAEENEVRVVADGEWRTTGEGMCRFEDPVDGGVYAYTDLEPFAAHRVFACFDQPDVKGRFRFRVRVPSGWQVVSGAPAGGPPEPDGDALRWSFAPTLPLPTYVTAVVAGPLHAVRGRHAGVDLGVFCRRSLAEHLDADEILEITKAGLAFFEGAFGYPYAFGKYDQVFVPEFLAGAMENAGCVTFNESYIFRSRVTDAARERRAGTILHEMAHMWFGDLVTMRWWDDLWLNESFASFAGELATTEGTRFTEAWTTFASTEKAWASRQDQLPTTHPIVADIPDVEAVHLNFDGITYAKGASVLRQLVAWVGPEAFLEGMRQYFHRHELGNTELADFLFALEETSGRDLHAWSKEWLETSGLNTLAVEWGERDGALDEVAVVQEVGAGEGILRRHRLAVGLFDLEGGKLTCRRRVELDLVGERAEVEALSGEQVPALILPNDGDLTFAKIRFGERSLATLEAHLGDLDDSLARAVCWRALWDMTRDGDLPARRYVRMVLDNVRGEDRISVVQTLLARTATAVSRYSDLAHRRAARGLLAERSLGELEAAEAGGDRQLAWARAFIAAAASPEHVGVVRGLLDGERTFEGLAVDTDLRWHIVRSLAGAGEIGDPEIAAELDRDPTDQGARHAAAARASAPRAEAKAEAWVMLLEAERPLATLEAIMSGFHQPEQEELLRPYAGRYFEELAEVWERHDLPVALAFGERMYPRLIVEPDTVEMTDRALSRRDLPGPLRRLLLEGKDELLRALRAREADARAGD